MKKALVVMLALVAACSDGSAASTTTATPTTAAPTTTSSVVQVDCGSVPYEVGTLPARVDIDRPGTDDVARDQFTTIPGTVARLWFDDAGQLAVALVRGSLPPIEWPGERGEVTIDGARGVAGPLDDGGWMVGWFEGAGDPCDQFFMVFYPPVESAEVQAAIASLNRTAG